MNLWRLEWLRLRRSPRLVSLIAVYLFFGFTGPLLAKYASTIFAHASGTGGVKIVFPEPVPADGIVNFVSNAAQTGLLVVIVIAAGTLALDARRGLAAFYRTRVHRSRDLVLPRAAVTAGAAITAYTLGTLAAWYETVVLLGRLPVGAVLAGLLCEAVYLTTAVAITALAATLVRGSLATIGVALGALLVMPLVGMWRPLGRVLPSALVSAPAELATGGQGFAHFLPALGVGVGLTGVLLVAAVALAGRREL